MGSSTMKNKLFVRWVHGKPVVEVVASRGEEVSSHLATHGIDTTVVRKTGTALAVLEMDADVNLGLVRSVLRQCEGGRHEMGIMQRL